MVVPYNFLPVELMWPMIEAQHSKVPELTDAARMWTQVRQWIEDTSTQLNTRVGELAPQWTDEAGREHEAKAQRTLSELKMWGERLDAARIPDGLNALAGTVEATYVTMQGINAAYNAAKLNPAAWPTLPGLQQAAGTAMTALGGQFDTSMLQVVSGSGLGSPGDVLPEGPQPAKDGNSPADFIKAATSGVNAASAGMDTLSALQDLGSSVTGTDLSSALAQPGSVSAGSTGPTLAGLAPSLTPVAGLSLGSLPSAGTPPVPSGMFGWAGGAAGAAAGLMPAARPVAGKRAPSLASEPEPGRAEESATKPSTGAMAPMMPRTGTNTAGTLHPGSVEPGSRSSSGRKSASGTDGVPATLRGRSRTEEAGEFTLARRRGEDDTDSGSVQLLDEDLWR
ncbi:hypothetical protein [Amycolatopsis sp.]|uniref:hypothetical protein n=1 Tax=Amycolatopsis sp. TaxID=37632 RepID=UPI002D019B4E|nr:hypothetical protein [Amycolatopsis sp.]HVV09006.1 hypothetical protein [Amycolatopsis sp.]